MCQLELRKIFDFDIGTKPTTISITFFVNWGKKPIFQAFLSRHFFGITILIKKADLIVFKSFEPFGFIGGNAYILSDLAILELLVVIVYRLQFALSIDYAHASNGKPINFAFMPPPPTAETKKDT